MGQSESRGEGAPHLDRLDMLRGIAVLVVLVYHWMPHAVGRDRLPWMGLWSKFSVATESYWLFYPFSHGWAAVPAFFVLSGFVIHLSTLKAIAKGHRFDPLSFYWRRFWRIYPVYVVAVVVFFQDPALKPFDLIAHLFCIHNIFEETFFTLSPAFWSLASEVQFYLAYPLLVPILLRKGGLEVLKYSVLFTLVVLAVMVLVYDPGVKRMRLFYAWSPLLTWGTWLLGAYMAERYFHKLEPLRIKAGWIVAGVCFFLLCEHLRLLFIFAFPVAGCLSAIWIERLARNSTPLAPWERRFLAVGTISYSLYVWHQPLLKYFSFWTTNALSALLPADIYDGKWFGAIKMVAGIVPVTVAMCLISWLSYHLIEMNGARLGSWLWEKMRTTKTTTIPDTAIRQLEENPR